MTFPDKKQLATFNIVYGHHDSFINILMKANNPHNPMQINNFFTFNFASLLLFFFQQLKAWMRKWNSFWEGKSSVLFLFFQLNYLLQWKNVWARILIFFFERIISLMNFRIQYLFEQDKEFWAATRLNEIYC